MIERILVAAVAKVANLICDYLVINTVDAGCCGCKVSMLADLLLKMVLVAVVAK